MSLAKYCPVCRRKIPQGHSYCAKCGGAATQPGSSRNQAEWSGRARSVAQTCSKCNSVIPSNVIECPKCGPPRSKQALKIALAVAMLGFGLYAYLISR